MRWRNYSKPFLKNSKVSISLNILLKFLYSLFLFYAKLRIIRIYWNWNGNYLLLGQIKLFKKTKWDLELASLPHFLPHFWRKVFFFLYSISWPNFIDWLSLLSKILGNLCIAIVFWAGFEVINFEINLIFLIKAFLLHNQKFKKKN